uniref:C3HC-type domain-containing protein n=1 Tax=Nelumbo nucifera TaxID=4432 RepID=A0A822YUI7_NELNU|nr:TPA_asm: hypothetical protein HUJ06_005861 [Nelumbo nucifera]
MAEDSEKRFNSIMDKLFRAPRPRSAPSSPEIQSSRGKKGGNFTLSTSMAESSSGRDTVGGLNCSAVQVGSAQAPLCRPWDRGDLMRRLATFKSMTWFGKPKVMSAVNCSRRGWINVETDIIACEACGARLLFSTPSSWTQQQVEKAAAVFSLKLDNGHKLLCPWIDNACDEAVAQFPPTAAPALVDGYRKRSRALLGLSALPVISSSAIDSMRSPQLEHFLKQSPLLDYGFESADASTTEYLGNQLDTGSSNLYYQAQKLISLCGWEPRLLPYVVECKDLASQSAKDAQLSRYSPQIVNGHGSGIVIYPRSSDDEVTQVDNDSPTLGHQSDPDSVVLDCGLCGASVGLWAFATVPQPLELFRFVGFSEVNGKNVSNNPGENAVSYALGNPVAHNADKENHVDNRGCTNDTGCNGATSSKEKSLKLNLTIAGGPPPTKQDYRARVSLPIISRHLRAGLSTNYDARYHILSTTSCMNEENVQFQSQKNNLPQQEKDDADTRNEQGIQPEGMESSKNKTNDGHSLSRNDGQVSCLDQNLSGMKNTVAYDHDISPEDTSIVGLPSHKAIGACKDSEDQNDTLHEDAEDARNMNAEKQVSLTVEVKDSIPETTEDANGPDWNKQISKNNSSLMIEADCCNHQEDNTHESLHAASHLEVNANEDLSSKINLGKGCPDFHISMDLAVDKQKVEEAKGKDQKKDELDQTMKFDPIKQHRHFCPWISSTANSLPGWKQTLYALDRRKECSHPLQADSVSSSSMWMIPLLQFESFSCLPPRKG